MGATRSSTLTCGPGALCDPAWPVLLEVAGGDFDLQPVVRLAIVKRTNRKTREYRGTKLMADSLKDTERLFETNLNSRLCEKRVVAEGRVSGPECGNTQLPPLPH